MNKIDTIFFDIGNVLLFFDNQRMYRQIAELNGSSPLEIQNLLEYTQQNVLYETGGLSTEDVYRDLQRWSLKSFTKDQLIHAMSDIFRPNDSIYPLVHALKQKGFRLGLLSNTCEAHFDHIVNQYSIFQEFEIPILSYKIRARKPHVSIYHAALKLAKRSPEQCFYLDDIPEYVEAASRLGIHAEVYFHDKQLKFFDYLGL